MSGRVRRICIDCKVRFVGEGPCPHCSGDLVPVAAWKRLRPIEAEEAEPDTGTAMVEGKGKGNGKGDMVTRICIDCKFRFVGDYCALKGDCPNCAGDLVSVAGWKRLKATEAEEAEPEPEEAEPEGKGKGNSKGDNKVTSSLEEGLLDLRLAYIFKGIAGGPGPQTLLVGRGSSHFLHWFI